MVSTQRIHSIAFFGGLPAWALRSFAEAAVERSVDRGEIILSQHDEATAVCFLVEGSVQFLLRFEGMDDLLVGTTGRPGTLLGWSAFRTPHRYVATVRSEDPCLVLKVPREVFIRVFERDPRLGCLILKRVAVIIANRLEQAKELLTRGADKRTSTTGDPGTGR